MFEKRYLASRLTATVLLLAAIAVAAVSAHSYLAMRDPAPHVDRVVPHAGFEKRRLSDWFDGLAGTPMDTDVFLQQGAEPGGTLLVLADSAARTLVTPMQLPVGVLVPGENAQLLPVGLAHLAKVMHGRGTGTIERVITKIHLYRSIFL